jgi:hypothetical protein
MNVKADWAKADRSKAKAEVQVQVQAKTEQVSLNGANQTDRGKTGRAKAVG